MSRFNAPCDVKMEAITLAVLINHPSDNSGLYLIESLVVITSNQCAITYICSFFIQLRASKTSIARDVNDSCVIFL